MRALQRRGRRLVGGKIGQAAPRRSVAHLSPYYTCGEFGLKMQIDAFLPRPQSAIAAPTVFANLTSFLSNQKEQLGAS